MEITKDLVLEINEAIKGQGYFVEETEVNKNRVIKKGLILKSFEGDNRVCPTLYVDGFENIDEVLDLISEVSKKGMPGFDMERLMSRDYILENVRAQVVAASNCMLTEGIVYREFLDLAIVYRVSVGAIDDGTGSYLVNEKILAQAGLTEEELFEVVSSDMRFNTVTMGQALARAMGMEDDNEFFDGLDNIFIISNDSLIHGAGVLCSDYLKVVRDRFESDYYILPSSLHEVIVLKAEDGVVPTDLIEMVKEVNSTTVRPEDMLTDAVYKFDGNGLSKVA